MKTLIERIETALSAHGGWAKLPELLTAMGESLEDASIARQVRSAMSSTGDIISNSTSGYRLTATATSSEIRHALNDYRSRAADLERRARMVEDVARSKPSPIPETIFGDCQLWS